MIERQDGLETREVESEVVGFNGQRLFLMPLEEVEGILPGARVYAKNTSGDGLQSGNSCRLVLPCWVACWTAAGSRSTGCPHRTPPKPAH